MIKHIVEQRSVKISFSTVHRTDLYWPLTNRLTRRRHKGSDSEPFRECRRANLSIGISISIGFDCNFDLSLGLSGSFICSSMFDAPCSSGASLHTACCPSARLNLLSIPLMVARDRNSASLTVKCHKFLRLVQSVALLLPSKNNKHKERFSL